MCDTMVVMKSATADASVLFAKNSDRSPNEPHIVIRNPAIDYPDGAAVACTYITIDQAPRTHATLLFMPAWGFGCEMGLNEFGLHIGNEAVFTKEKAGKSGLTGMDLCRLALERSKTAEEGLRVILDLLAAHGQGGDCGYDHPFYYHNSFLIADENRTFILETAGEYWAWKQVHGVGAISNALTIERDYDDIHPGAIDHAIRKRWCRNKEDFSFAGCYTDPVRNAFAGAGPRRTCALEALKPGGVTVEGMIGVLRSHNARRPFERGAGSSICMHAGPRPGASHTTGSLVSHFGGGHSVQYFTGASTPCLSMFKPTSMAAGHTQLIFPAYAKAAAREAWLWRERLHRAVLQGRLRDGVLENYYKDRDKIERTHIAWAEDAFSGARGPREMAAVAKRALDDEIALIARTLEALPEEGKRIGGPLARRYWTKKDRHLEGPPPK
ncbi:MAG: hypothetical protein ACOX88_09155 [Christensenellales bacterium]|jgi:secernin